MISHFLLNLQDISTVTSNDSDPSRPSFVRSDPGQASSIRFNSIIGNLGAPVRDGSHEDNGGGEDMDGMEGAALLDMQQDDEEMRVGIPLSGSADTREENVAGPSRLAAARA